MYNRNNIFDIFSVLVPSSVVIVICKDIIKIKNLLSDILKSLIIKEREDFIKLELDRHISFYSNKIDLRGMLCNICLVFDYDVSLNEKLKNEIYPMCVSTKTPIIFINENIPISLSLKEIDKIINPLRKLEQLNIFKKIKNNHISTITKGQYKSNSLHKNIWYKYIYFNIYSIFDYDFNKKQINLQFSCHPSKMNLNTINDIYNYLYPNINLQEIINIIFKNEMECV